MSENPSDWRPDRSWVVGRLLGIASRGHWPFSSAGDPPRDPSTDCWKEAGFMPLTQRGEAVGYDAHLMTFKFTMRNGEQIVQCRISSAALGNLAGGWRSSAQDLPTEFEAHRELSEAIASEQFDQTSNKETKLVSIFAKHIRTRTAQT
jgi:hypothetical protein